VFLVVIFLSDVFAGEDSKGGAEPRHVVPGWYPTVYGGVFLSNDDVTTATLASWMDLVVPRTAREHGWWLPSVFHHVRSRTLGTSPWCSGPIQSGSEDETWDQSGWSSFLPLPSQRIRDGAPPKTLAPRGIGWDQTGPPSSAPSPTVPLLLTPLLPA